MVQVFGYLIPRVEREADPVSWLWVSWTGDVEVSWGVNQQISLILLCKIHLSDKNTPLKNILFVYRGRKLREFLLLDHCICFIDEKQYFLHQGRAWRLPGIEKYWRVGELLIRTDRGTVGWTWTEAACFGINLWLFLMVLNNLYIKAVKANVWNNLLMVSYRSSVAEEQKPKGCWVVAGEYLKEDCVCFLQW